MNLKIGSSGGTVTKVQYTLHILGYAPNGIDGSFGVGMESAVKRYQSYYGMAQTGIVVGCSGNIVTTIEGNSSYRVNKKKYYLNNTYIDGYGVVNPLPVITDPDNHPDKPDNPDQIPPATAQEHLHNRMMLIFLVW